MYSTSRIKRESRESPYGLSCVPSVSLIVPSETGSRLSRKNLAFLEKHGQSERGKNAQENRSLAASGFDTNKPYGASIVEHEYGGTGANQ